MQKMDLVHPRENKNNNDDDDENKKCFRSGSLGRFRERPHRNGRYGQQNQKIERKKGRNREKYIYLFNDIKINYNSTDVKLFRWEQFHVHVPSFRSAGVEFPEQRRPHSCLYNRQQLQWQVLP